MPGSTPKPSFTSTAAKAMSLVSSSTAILPAPSKATLNLRGRPVQRAVVEDVVVPLPRIWAGVEQFLRIDAGGRRARDVADVVGAGAARAQAEILDALDQLHRVLRRNLAHLQIGAGGDIGRTARTAARRDRPGLQTASASGCRSESATGTCRNPAPAPHRTGRNSASGNYPPATAAHWSSACCFSRG